MDLEQAIELAARAHRGQVDKRGEPYILHPLRVMQHCYPDQEAMIVGVLHDTLEDTHVTEQELLAAGCPIHIVEAIHLLTRREDDSYWTFIQRLVGNPLARRVKIKDLEDNMSKERNPPPVDEKTSRRLLKYRRAHAYLFAALLDEELGQTPGTTYSSTSEQLA